MDKEWRKIIKDATKTKSAYLTKSVETPWKQKESGWEIAQCFSKGGMSEQPWGKGIARNITRFLFHILWEKQVKTEIPY